MKKICVPFFAIFLLVSCNKNAKTAEDQDLNKKFDGYKDNFVNNLWKTYPGWASGVGFHKYDSILLVPNSEEDQKQLDFANAQLDSLKSYSIDNLSDKNKTDYHMIKNQLDGIIFSIKELKSSQWNPAEYNVCGAFAEILNGNYDSLEVRLKAFNAKMNNIPAYYEVAKQSIF